MGRAAEEIGGNVLGVREYREWVQAREGDGVEYPAVATIIRRFGSWREALAQCGLRDARSRPPLEEDPEDRDALVRVAAALGTTHLSRTHYDRYRATEDPTLPHSETIRRRFGSWAAALEAAGIGASARSQLGRRFSDDEVRAALAEAAAATSGALSANAYQRWREGAGRPLPAAQTIIHRFGRWREALAEAGVRGVHDGPDREFLARELRGFADRLGSPRPSANAYRLYRARHDPSLPPLSAYYRGFGSWPAALAAAGLGRGWERLDAAALADVLARVAEDLGLRTLRAATYRDYRAAHDPSLPAPSTYYFRFGSWPEALEAAGLEVPEPMHV